jgi:hypothetical protein
VGIRTLLPRTTSPIEGQMHPNRCNTDQGVFIPHNPQRHMFIMPKSEQCMHIREHGVSGSTEAEPDSPGLRQCLHPPDHGKADMRRVLKDINRKRDDRSRFETNFYLSRLTQIDETCNPARKQGDPFMKANLHALFVPEHLRRCG